MSYLHRRVVAVALSFTLPLAVFADNPGTGVYEYTFKEFVQYQILPLINAGIAFLFSAAVAVFFYGIVRFIASSAGAKDKVQGRELMLWGIVALFVMVAVWGIVAVLKATFLS